MMNKLVKNSAQLLVANAIAQVIGLLVYPILTRMYAAADFGFLNLFMGIGSVLAIMSTAEYHYAIVLPKENRKAVALLAIGGLIILLLEIALLILGIWREDIAEQFAVPRLARFWRLLCVFIGLTGIWNLHNYWLLRQEKFGAVSAFQIAQSLIGAAAKLTFACIGWLEQGLVISVVLSLFMALLVSLFVAYKGTAAPVLAQLHTSWADIKFTAIEYKNFPYYSLPKALFNSLCLYMPAFLLTPTFGLEQLGYFAMAITLGQAPLQMISRSIYQVLYQHISKLVNERKPIIHLVWRFIRYAVLALCPLFIMLAFFLPDLTEWLLGFGWSTTGRYIRIMLPWLLVAFISPTIGFIPDVFFRQGQATIIEAVYVFLRIIALLLGVWSGSFLIAVFAFSISGLIVQLYQLFWYVRIMREYEQSLATLTSD